MLTLVYKLYLHNLIKIMQFNLFVDKSYWLAVYGFIVTK